MQSSLARKLPDGWSAISLAKAVKQGTPITYGIVQTGPGIPNGVRCVRVVDLARNEIDIDAMITTTEEISRPYHRTLLSTGDIMFALRGNIGLVRQANEVLVGANLTRGVALISPRDDFDSSFLLWAIRAPAVRDDILRRVNGSALKEIPLRELRRVKVPVPPLPEQRKIAEILSSVDEAIRATQAVIEQTRRVKEGLLQEMLTKGIGHTRFKKTAIGEIPESWSCVALGKILPTSKHIKPGPFGSALTKSMFVAKGVKIYGQEQVLAGDLSVGDYYISQERFSELQVFAVEEGDLLLTLVGAGTPGKVLVVKAPFEHGLINPRLIRLRPPAGTLSSEFLARVFQAPFTQREILRIGQGGAMPVLSAGLVRGLPIPVPPLDEQQAIVRQLEDVDEGLRLEAEVLVSQRLTKAGLLQDLLTGKVRVTA